MRSGPKCSNSKSNWGKKVIGTSITGGLIVACFTKHVGNTSIHVLLTLDFKWERIGAMNYGVPDKTGWKYHNSPLTPFTPKQIRNQ